MLNELQAWGVVSLGRFSRIFRGKCNARMRRRFELAGSVELESFPTTPLRLRSRIGLLVSADFAHGQNGRTYPEPKLLPHFDVCRLFRSIGAEKRSLINLFYFFCVKKCHAFHRYRQHSPGMYLATQLIIIIFINKIKEFALAWNRLFNMRVSQTGVACY